jgi:hypothetical protein
MTKYHNRKTKIDGITFDSLAEAARYGELKLLQQAGEIEKLAVHPRMTVWQYGKEKITYIGDFLYTENGRMVCEDVKGVRTDVFNLKAKLFRAAWPDIELRIVEAK